MHALADRVPAALAVPDARGVRGHAEGPEAAESQLLADLYERATADDGRGGPFDRVALAAGAAAGVSAMHAGGSHDGGAGARRAGATHVRRVDAAAALDAVQPYRVQNAAAGAEGDAASRHGHQRLSGRAAARDAHAGEPGAGAAGRGDGAHAEGAVRVASGAGRVYDAVVTGAEYSAVHPDGEHSGESPVREESEGGRGAASPCQHVRPFQDEWGVRVRVVEADGASSVCV